MARDLGVIDFQDALMGPATYDLASLLRDAYIELDEALIDRLIDRYLDQVATHGQVRTNREAFRRLFDFTSIQRNLKAAGRFVYIDRVKGQSQVSRRHSSDAGLCQAESPEVSGAVRAPRTVRPLCAGTAVSREA